MGKTAVVSEQVGSPAYKTQDDLEFPPTSGEWDVPVRVQVRNKLDTLAVLTRVLSTHGLMLDYEAIALAGAIFYVPTGWTRVNGSWVHWSRKTDDGGDWIWVSLLRNSEEVKKQK